MDPETLQKQFGQRVQRLRRERGLTQEALAEAIARSLDTVGNIETGRASTRLETAQRLAEALGVSLPELFEFAEATPVGDREQRRAIERIVRLLRPHSAERVAALADLLERILALPR